jgi:hypothetical protein
MSERRKQEEEKGLRRDDRILRVLRNIEALDRQRVDIGLDNKALLASIDKSLKALVAALPREVGKLKRQAMIFGAVKI